MYAMQEVVVYCPTSPACVLYARLRACSGDAKDKEDICRGWISRGRGERLLSPMSDVSGGGKTGEAGGEDMGEASCCAAGMALP